MNEGDVWDFYDYKRQPSRCLPIGVVLTIAATGSEMSDSSVITKEDGWIKRGYSNDLSRPRFAVMNPDLTKTLPDYQTACGCTDILMHTMERYFTNGGNMEITDSMAEALMRTVIKNAKILAEDPLTTMPAQKFYGPAAFPTMDLPAAETPEVTLPPMHWSMKSAAFLMLPMEPGWLQSGEAGQDMSIRTACPGSTALPSM